ncbi:MAG: ribonuclease HII [Candidatus Pacebacteria bacterium]|nr:ribonuclease HII [Candidatus Paceibacterota bacterium]
MELSRDLFEYEKKLAGEGYGFIIGVDEVGRGPLAGPVVACAVMARNFQFSIFNFQTNSNDKIFNEQDFFKKINLIKDSKLLSEKQREGLCDFILENFYVGVGMCDHETIDRMNILEATYLSMKKALADLSRNMREEVVTSKDKILDFRFSILDFGSKSIILVDENKVIPNFSAEQRAVVGGDKLIKSISAASIVAKVTRDRIMKKMHAAYPQYDFARHKGYGTKVHMDALKKYGPCEIHRKSFRPVRESMPDNANKKILD